MNLKDLKVGQTVTAVTDKNYPYMVSKLKSMDNQLSGPAKEFVRYTKEFFEYIVSNRMDGAKTSAKWMDHWRDEILKQIKK